MKTLMELMTNHPEGVHATSEWRGKAYGTILCPECHKIDRTRFPKPIDITLNKHPGHRIEGGIWWTGTNIFHLNFVNQIRKHLSGFTLGQCYDPTGKLIEEYVTCYSKDYIVVRGNKESKYYICKTCGSIQSHEWWHGKQYVLDSYLTDSLIYQDCLCNMFLDEELACRLDFSAWSDVELEPIATRDEPMDGQHLPCDCPGALCRNVYSRLL